VKRDTHGSACPDDPEFDGWIEIHTDRAIPLRELQSVTHIAAVNQLDAFGLTNGVACLAISYMAYSNCAHLDDASAGAIFVLSIEYDTMPSTLSQLLS
jgi:hypothetical protein